MSAEIPAGLLQLITAAVTPVAMISAAAIIISTIGSKHQSMSDRVRALAAESRDPSTSEARRCVLTQQLYWFERRIHYSANAHRLLYLAIAAFVFTVLLIILTPTGVSWTPAAYVLFVAGVTLMLIAVVFEFIELWWTNRTLSLEIQDALDHCSKPGSKAAEKVRVKHG